MHGSGPTRIATPSSYRTCTNYSLPVSRRTNCSPGVIASVPTWYQPIACWSRSQPQKLLDRVTSESILPIGCPGSRPPPSHAEKDALIAALTARLILADERIAALEARLDELTRPPKTPGNSSKPPSHGQKQDLPAAATDRAPRKSRPGVGRTLHPHPDRTIDKLLTACPKYEAVFPDALQTPQQVYERIELPPVRPDVTQIRLFGARCAYCGERVTAKPPTGLEPGSPFGHSIAAMVVYLHYATQPWLAPMLDWEEQQRARRSLERRLSAAVRHHQLRMDWVDPRVDPYT
jgi:hypothetical protein